MRALEHGESEAFDFSEQRKLAGQCQRAAALLQTANDLCQSVAPGERKPSLAACFADGAAPTASLRRQNQWLHFRLKDLEPNLAPQSIPPFDCMTVYTGEPMLAEKRLSSDLRPFSKVIDAPSEIGERLKTAELEAGDLIDQPEAMSKLFHRVAEGIDFHLLRQALDLYARPFDADTVRAFLAALGKGVKLDRILYKQSGRFVSCMNVFLAQEERKYGHFAIVPNQATILGGSFAVFTPLEAGRSMALQSFETLKAAMPNAELIACSRDHPVPVDGLSVEKLTA